MAKDHDLMTSAHEIAAMFDVVAERPIGFDDRDPDAEAAIDPKGRIAAMVDLLRSPFDGMVSASIGSPPDFELKVEDGQRNASLRMGPRVSVLTIWIDRDDDVANGCHVVLHYEWEFPVSSFFGFAKLIASEQSSGVMSAAGTVAATMIVNGVAAAVTRTLTRLLDDRQRLAAEAIIAQAHQIAAIYAAVVQAVRDVSIYSMTVDTEERCVIANISVPDCEDDIAVDLPLSEQLQDSLGGSTIASASLHSFEFEPLGPPSPLASIHIHDAFDKEIFVGFFKPIQHARLLRAFDGDVEAVGAALDREM